MATISEDYVSFETAKLLKEKGFSENTEHKIWYVIKQFSAGCHWNSCTYKVGDTTRKYDSGCCISMPTHQMAMKWLREKYYIYADPIKQGNYNDCSEYYTWIVARMGIIHRNSSVADKLSYEEACEAAIKYCLENLI